ncbi:MAG TPA: hypothetical protein VMB22_07350 [Verrucomicrobiae bacterium]|nr:hypothetical protein [Verrucomicrobiae bacterium]
MSTPAFKKMAVAVLAASVLAGCATQPINWAARVGNYTYDQAVKDYGQPDNDNKLPSGTIVAEWLIERGQTVVQPQGPYWTGPYRPFAPGSSPDYGATQFPSRYLELTFNKDGVLTGEREYSR